MSLDGVFELVKTTTARHFILNLQARSKQEYQNKIRELYRNADELQKVLGMRVVLWMKRLNSPGTFFQVWELLVIDPMIMRLTTEVVEY